MLCARIALCTTILLLPLGASAEPTRAFLRCEEQRAEIAEDHREKAEKALARHDEELTDILEKYFDRNPVTPEHRQTLLGAARRIIVRYQLDNQWQTYVEEPIDTLMDFGEPDDPDIRCGRSRDNRQVARLSLLNYEAILAGARDEISNRLSFEHLDEDEGLLVVAVYAYGKADRVVIDRVGSMRGTIAFGPVSNSAYFRIHKVRAGEYRYEKIEQYYRNGQYYFDLGHRDMRFTVEPGVINYAGVFIFDQLGSRAQMTLNDRTSITMTVLRQRYPDLLDTFGIANGLVPDDRFIEFYMNEQNAVEAQVDE